MASVHAHIELDETELNKQAVAFGRRRMSSLQRRIATQARVDVPVRTGHLGRSIGEGRIGLGGPRTVTGSVHANAHYARYVHQGTGGPERKIYPRHAQTLRFEIGGRVIYRAWVRGVRARPFLRNAGLRVAAAER